MPQSKGFLSFFSKKKSNVRSHIVQNVSGIAKSGEVIAIMGASGAGKDRIRKIKISSFK